MLHKHYIKLYYAALSKRLRIALLIVNLNSVLIMGTCNYLLETERMHLYVCVCMYVCFYVCVYLDLYFVFHSGPQESFPPSSFPYGRLDLDSD